MMTSQLFQKRMKIISVRSWIYPLQNMVLTLISSQISRKSNRSLPSVVLLNRNKKTQNKMNQHFNWTIKRRLNRLKRTKENSGTSLIHINHKTSRIYSKLLSQPEAVQKIHLTIKKYN